MGLVAPSRERGVCFFVSTRSAPRGGRLTRLLLVPAKIALTVLVTWWIFRGLGLNLSELLTIDLSALSPRPVILVASICVLWIAFTLSAVLWKGLVAELGGPQIPWTVAAGTVLVANLGRYIPGKVWQLAGLAYLTSRRGVSARVAAMAAIAGQIFHLAGAALIGGVVVFRYTETSVLWGFGVLGVTFVILAGLGETRGFRALLLRAAMGKNDEPESAFALRRGFAFRWLIPYTLNWLVLGTSFFLLGLGLGLPVEWSGAVTGFAAAYLLGYLAVFAPAGIGIREGVLVALFQPGLGPAPALALASAQRVWITLAEALGALLGWLVLRPPVTDSDGSDSSHAS